MKQAAHFSVASLNYARAILELAGEQNLSIESIGEELIGLREIIDSDNAFRLYLADPAIGGNPKLAMLKRILDGRISPLLMRVIGVLNDKDHLSLLHEIAGAYDELLDQKLGKIEVDLIVAQKLSPEQLEESRKQISATLKRDAVVHAYVDETIIGGAMLRVGDQLIDASVKQQLETIRQKMLAARTK